MPISYKHKIYTTLGTPTDLSGDVVSATDNAGVPTKDYTVKGETIVWNQLLDKSKYPATTTTNGVTFTNNGDGSIAVNGTATDDSGFLLFSPYADSLIPGHKYLISGSPNDASINAYIQCYDSINRQWLRDAGGGGIAIFPKVVGPNVASFIRIRIAGGYTANNLVFKPQLFDLTQMFGAGNEPTTVAQFCAMFPDDYYPYNAGELKSIMPTSVEASTVNLLNLVGRKEISSDTVGHRTPTDAYPEIDTHVYYRGVSPNGYLMSNTVTEATVLSSSVIVKTGTSPASRSYGVGVPLTVVPSTTYYIKCTTSGVVSLGYANSNKVITSFGGLSSNNQFTTPGDCRYVLIVFKPNAIDALATFENICVSAVQTNEYQPYNKYRANIPSSKYFPDGMKSAGSVYDEINFLSQKAIKRIGAVDMGSLNWTYISSNVGHERFEAPIENIKIVSSASTKGNLVCSKYVTDTPNSVFDHTADKVICSHYTAAQIWVYDTAYTDAATFKAAMSGVMLYYELDTPISTAITPPLQALSTYRGFTSFSAPNSLTQNGPLSVTYYAEGGTNPEKGWLTSYKRKLYMGRNIEWNQLRTNQTSSGSGSTSVQYAKIGSAETSLVYGHKYYVRFYVKYGAGNTNDSSVGFKLGNFGYAEFSMAFFPTDSFVLQEQISTLNSSAGAGENRSGFIKYSDSSKVLSIEWKNLQIFDLTQMFGAGNEPSTPEEFWSYFDHKLYPYNAGETQPLFKISRKSYIYKEPAGYTVYFADWVWIADTVTITVEYADGSTATLTSQSDVSGKSYSNIVKMTFTDTDSDRYVRYKMPANGGSEETLYMMPTVTLVFTADAEIEEIGK